MKNETLSVTALVAAATLATTPVTARAAAPEGEATQVSFPHVEVSEVVQEGTGIVVGYSYADDFGLTVPPHLLCGTLEIWFDAGCRDKAWLEANIAAPGGMVRAFGSRFKSSAPAYVLVTEQTSSETFDRVLISDQKAVGGASLGPTRNGYPIESIMRQSLLDQGDSNFVLLTESLEPGLSPGGVTQWSTVDWDSVEYQPGSHPTHCDPDGCVTAYTSNYSCEKIAESVKSSTYTHCMTAGDGAFLMAMIGVWAIGSGVIVGVAISGAGAGLSTPAGVAAGIAIAGGGTSAGAAWAHMVCDDQGVQAAFKDGVKRKCIDLSPGGGGGEGTPGEDDDGLADIEGAEGCLECTEWGTDEFETGHWDPVEGEYTVELHEELVCLSWSVDPMGSDDDGDGWCD